MVTAALRRLPCRTADRPRDRRVPGGRRGSTSLVLRDPAGSYRPGAGRHPRGHERTPHGGRVARRDDFAPRAPKCRTSVLTTSAFWVRLPLHGGRRGRRLAARGRWPVVDRVTLYEPDGSGGWQSSGRATCCRSCRGRSPTGTRRSRCRAGRARRHRVPALRRRGLIAPAHGLVRGGVHEHRRRGGVHLRLLLRDPRDPDRLQPGLLVTARSGYLYYVLLISAWGLCRAALNGFTTQYLWRALGCTRAGRSTSRPGSRSRCRRCSRAAS